MQIEQLQTKDTDLAIWAERLKEQLNLSFTGSATWNPGSIANGAEEMKEVTVTGAALGDFAIPSFSLDVTDLQLTADVTAANTVTALLNNNTGGAIDLASGTIYILVIKRNKL